MAISKNKKFKNPDIKSEPRVQNYVMSMSRTSAPYTQKAFSSCVNLMHCKTYSTFKNFSRNPF